MESPRRFAIIAIAFAIGISQATAQTVSNAAAQNRFQWPVGKRATVSLTWDDARTSQVDAGLAVLKKAGVKATFYVQAPNVEKRLEGWKQAVADSHEIGSHTVTHPCTGNYPFSRQGHTWRLGVKVVFLSHGPFAGISRSRSK